MEKPTYFLKSSPDALQHVFESIGDDKIVKKAVAYVVDKENDSLYQLIFGDLTETGEIDTLSVSNNNDMKMVLTTVVSTLFAFFEQNPDKIVFFTGSTLSRTRLYRAVIAKFIAEAELFYHVMSITESGNLHIFDRNQTFIGYLIRKKNESKN